MDFRKYSSNLGAITLALSVELVTLSLLIPPLRANPLEISLRFPNGEDIGAPARTVGGGQRGSLGCLMGNIPLTAVTPINNGVKTLLKNPSLYLYVPKTKASSAEFIVVDEDGEKVYSTDLALTNTPSLVEVSLPNTVSLTPGKEFTWHFAVICNPKNRDRDKFVRGLILPTTLAQVSEEFRQETGKQLTEEQKQMLNPDELTKNLEQLKTNPQEAKKLLQQQIQEYNNVGVWSELITIFTKLSETFPNDCNLANQREEIFNSVELASIGQQFEAKSCLSNSQ